MTVSCLHTRTYRTLGAAHNMVVAGASRASAPPLARALRRPRPAWLSSAATRKPVVAVGVSGGVDSSVAALLLKRQGFDVVGVHMQNWDEEDELGGGACPATQDYKDAKEVCGQLGIGFECVSFVKDYWTNVFLPTVEGYERGVTPNPDVLCNREIKFASLLQHVTSQLGADLLATGHYARLKPAVTGLSSSAVSPRTLHCGADGAKDQSYFLALVPPSAFQRAVFPLGNLHKTQVRVLAEEAGLATANKAESMGLCFIGKRRFQSFLPQYLDPGRGGVFVSVVDGREMGPHHGAALYTVGQGAKIGGSVHKWFVCGKCMASRHVYVCPGTQHPALYSDTLQAHAHTFNWIGDPPQPVLDAMQGKEGASLECQYRVRYRQPLANCRVTFRPPLPTDSPSSSPEEAASGEAPLLGGGGQGGERGGLRLCVEFQDPQRAVAEGQTLVLYDGDRCLGGGLIVSAGKSYFERQKPLPPRLVRWEVGGGEAGQGGGGREEGGKGGEGAGREAW